MAELQKPEPIPEVDEKAEPPVTTTTESSSFSSPLPELKPVTENLAIAAEEAKTGKKLAPFLTPLPDCKPADAPTLTTDQEAKYSSLLEHCNAISELPVSTEKNAAKRALDENERMWLTRECLLRYLRATKWNLSDAKKRLEGTLVWRREYGVLDHTADYISPENETGKQVLLGFDNQARPCLYLNPARQNTKTSPRQIEHLVFMLERAVDMMPPGQETLALLVDFKSSSSSSNPSVGQGRQTLNILQNHYPERLGRALVINIPWFVWGFFKLINPFIDPLTREKLKFNEKMVEHVPASQLDKEFGGEVPIEYIHTTYWPELNRICDEKRAAQKIRWKALGSKIGESEFAIKGGNTIETSENITDGVEKLDLKE